MGRNGGKKKGLACLGGGGESQRKAPVAFSSNTGGKKLGVGVSCS